MFEFNKKVIRDKILEENKLKIKNNHFVDKTINVHLDLINN